MVNQSHQLLSKWCSICSFVQEGTGEALPECAPRPKQATYVHVCVHTVRNLRPWEQHKGHLAVLEVSAVSGRGRHWCCWLACLLPSPLCLRLYILIQVSACVCGSVAFQSPLPNYARLLFLPDLREQWDILAQCSCAGQEVGCKEKENILK